ncbi:hypothetical protein HSBAA_33920 [Vreelandella sulfidaeris]|uniref:Berberine/berberine-like domain-containing protein n=1 Tax=Vreelandella sulfidaeris TaxID=115553 RepID=A0A455U7J5_9GAMM|nr:hypothetical protein HSBAA_33920 [Halomonas sulfidaeris]
MSRVPRMRPPSFSAAPLRGQHPHSLAGSGKGRRSPWLGARAFEALAPYSAGVYVNFMPAEESARVAEAYGANYARLTTIKACYDPENRFRLNQNIIPDAEVQLAG